MAEIFGVTLADLFVYDENNHTEYDRALLEIMVQLEHTTHDEFDNIYTISEIVNESNVLDEITTFLMEILNIIDNDDCDFIIASYVLNYDNVDGDFSVYDEPGEEILLPKKSKYDATKEYYSSVLFVEHFDSHEYYLPSMMSWDIQEGYIDSEDSHYCGIEDIMDTWDEEIKIEKK